MSKKRFIAINNQADTSTLELYFLDVIADTYDWYTGYTSQVQSVIDKVNAYKPSKIKVIIDSEGGDASSGMAIYNFLKRSDAKVEVEIIGLAASIASVIAMAANKGKLLIAKNAFIMIHNAEGGVWGTSDEIRKGADVVDMYTNQIIDIYAQRTGKSNDEIKALMDNGDYWMTGEQAVEQGFADDTFNGNPNVQIAARLDTTQYKNIPVQIRAQLAPVNPDDQTSFIKNQLDDMKKFFTDIVNAIRGTKPADDANPQTVVTNLADAIQAPFEKLGDEIEATITNKVKEVTGEAFVTDITNKVKEALPAAPVVNFSEGDAKTSLDAAVKVAVENAVKDISEKVTKLETVNNDLKKRNEDLDKELTNSKGGKNQANDEEDGVKTIGSFNKRK